MVKINQALLEKADKRRKQVSVPLGKGASGIISGGLVPLGYSGIYVTPDEPADPRDCERFPTSPWCGQNPFDKKPVGIGWNVTVNECGIKGTIIPVLGFVKAPPISAAYLRPECRGEELIPANPKIQPLFTRADIGNDPTKGFDRGGQDKKYVAYVGIGVQALLYDGEDEPMISEFGTGNQILPSNKSYVDLNGITRISPVIAYGTQGDSIQGSGSVELLFNFQDGDGYKIVMVEETGLINRVGNIAGDIFENYPANTGTLLTIYSSNIIRYREHQLCLYYGRVDAIENYFKQLHKRVRPVDAASWHCWDIYNPDDEPSPERKRWGTPERSSNKGDCDCMGCCPPDPKLDELLAWIKKVYNNLGEYPSNFEDWDSDPNQQGIQKNQKSITSTREAIRFSTELSNRLSRILGIDLLPFSLPKTTVEKDNGGVLGDIWDAVTPDETETITSVMDFFKWIVLNDSANMGQWQRVIEEEGVQPPPDENGNQSPAPKQKIVLPDVATTMEESIRLDIRTQKTLGLITDILIKLQLEVAGIKTIAAQSLLRVEDVQEFLDYPTTEKSSKVPLQITVPSPNASQQEQNDLHKFEKPSEAYVRYDDWTGDDSLRMQLIQLLQLARYIKANQTGQ